MKAAQPADDQQRRPPFGLPRPDFFDQGRRLEHRLVGSALAFTLAAWPGLSRGREIGNRRDRSRRLELDGAALAVGQGEDFARPGRIGGHRLRRLLGRLCRGIVLKQPIGRGDLGVGLVSSYFARIVLGHRIALALSVVVTSYSGDRAL